MRTPTDTEIRGLLASGGRGGADLSDAMAELEALDKLYDDNAWKEPEQLLASIGEELEYIFNFRRDRIVQTKRLVKNWREKVRESKENARVNDGKEEYDEELKRIEREKRGIIKDILKKKSEQERLKEAKGTVLKDIQELDVKKKRYDEQVQLRLPALRARLNMMMTILGLYIFPKDEEGKTVGEGVVKGFVACTISSDCVPFEYNTNEQVNVDIADDLWDKIENA